MISRRGSARWALPTPSREPAVEVLIPTADRSAELATTLAGLAAQDDPAFDVVISDQSHDAAADASPAVRAMCRVLRAQGRGVRILSHLPRRGMAEQRQFLLDASSARRVLFLDDDIWLEPGSLARLARALDETRAGFVGFAPQGLSFLDDDRPHERTALEFWSGESVRPERVRRGTAAFDRWPLHNAANLAHAAVDLGLDDDDARAYRIAWVGACVLYDRAALITAGGFDFWPRLPVAHAGEDATAEWRVMERDGGAGVLPSGAVHLEAPTRIEDRRVEASDIVFGPPPTSSGRHEARTREERGNDERHPESDPDPEAPRRHRLSRRAG